MAQENEYRQSGRRVKVIMLFLHGIRCCIMKPDDMEIMDMSDNVVGISDLNQQYALLKEEVKSIAGDPLKTEEDIAQVNKLLDENRVLREASEDIGGLVSFVSDSISGEFTRASAESLEAVIGAFMYLLKNDDAINDSTPVVGYLDDLRVFSIAREDAKKDLAAYSAWSAER